MRNREERRPIQVLFEEERLSGDARLIVKDDLPVSHWWHGVALPGLSCSQWDFVTGNRPSVKVTVVLPLPLWRRPKIVAMSCLLKHRTDQQQQYPRL
jgi:hypothetical protein